MFHRNFRDSSSMVNFNKGQVVQNVLDEEQRTLIYPSSAQDGLVPCCPLGCSPQEKFIFVYVYMVHIVFFVCAYTQYNVGMMIFRIKNDRLGTKKNNRLDAVACLNAYSCKATRIFGRFCLLCLKYCTLQ